MMLKMLQVQVQRNNSTRCHQTKSLADTNLHKILSRSIQNFLSNRVNERTDIIFCLYTA